MKNVTLCIRCLLYFILCILSKADIISKHYTMEPSLHNKVSNISLVAKHHSESLIECSAKCGELCACFGFNTQLKKCCIHRSCDPSNMTEDETGWMYFIPDEPSVADRCSSNVNCPDNAVCDRGTCVCSGTYLAIGKVCHNVTNLALGKPVSGSSLFQNYNGAWGNAVDGRTKVTDFNLLFHTSFELYPWLTVTLGRLSIVKSTTIYNRIGGNGAWLHNVETRVGNTTDWTQMSTCGTFVGPSVTGGVHVIECEKLLYGMFVTMKIVKPNHITGDPNASGGKNCLVLEEVVIAGILV